jgi:enoyl-CoA hydratase/carnithine racemase
MQSILTSMEGGILKIELNRPQKRNALTFTPVKMQGSSIRSSI